MIQEYQSISSTIEITWNPSFIEPRSSSGLYYHYELVDGLNELVMIVGNTSNTSTVIEDLPYNHDILFTLSAINCVERSSPSTYHINVGKRKLILAILWQL